MITKHRITNILHSLLLISGMLLLLSIVGQLIFGSGLLFWIVLLGILPLFILPQAHPGLIMRLYGAIPLTQADAPILYQQLQHHTLKAALQATPTLYILPSSIRNAFTVGSQAKSAIALTYGILNSLSQRELSAVLAHEISHLKNHDLWLMSLSDAITRLTTLLATLGTLLLLINLPLMLLGYAAFPWLAVILLIASPWLSTLLQLALSRTREFDADASAVELTGDPQGLASALNKIDPEKNPFWARIGIPVERDANPSLLRTHPKTGERIKRLLEMDKTAQPAAIHMPMSHPPHRVQLVIRQPRRHWTGIWY